MAFKKFTLQLSIRLAAILALFIVIAFFLQQQGYFAVTTLLIGIAIMQCVALFKYVNKTNLEMARFLDALKYADFSQHFNFAHTGNGFEELGNSIEAVLQKQQQIAAQKEAKYRQLAALVEQVPVPLISLHEDNRVTLWNSKARKLLGILRCENTDDLNQLGENFAAQLTAIPNGGTRLIKIANDGMEQQLMVTASDLIVEGKQERLISLQNIQSELDAAQLQAWQDLVRVLTHEIMNSITPIASLAKTADELIHDVKTNYANSSELAEELDDIASAVHTVAKRSDGLTQFVNSYRKLTRLPAPSRSTFLVSDFIEHISSLVSQDLAQQGIQLITSVNPAQLQLFADKEMLTQVFINLIKNAEQALHNTPNPTIEISAGLNSRDHTTIKITDNGSGLATDLIEQIFVPFFTTKKEGSGVGLALTRQAMILHGGAVKAENAKTGGAIFTLIF